MSYLPLGTFVAALLALSLATGCGEKEDSGSQPDTGTPPVDLDGDGYSVEDGDCDDQNPAIHPNAQEVCDEANVDEDCSGTADNDDGAALDSGKSFFYPDRDGDGFGDEESAGSLLCDPTTSFPEDDNSDCDDHEGGVNPGAQEVCDGFGVDEDCNGLANDEDPNTDQSTQVRYFEDADEDGYGDALDAGEDLCEPSGVRSATENSDCNDSDAGVNPGATEVCDEADVDEDCSGAADDADPGVDADSQALYFFDRDGDGFGSDEDEGTLYCDAPSGNALEGSDCDDADSTVNPGATEVCDEADADEDCSGAADDADPGVDASTQRTWYVDADADGYGDLADAGTAFCDAPSGFVLEHTDCDDGAAEVHPGAVEILCSGVIESCTGSDGDIVVPTDAPTITSAVRGASFGDVICVNSGTYYGPIEISDYLEIYAVTGATVTIDGRGTGRVVDLDGADGTVVQGFHLTGGYSSDSDGGCVNIDNSNNVEINDNTIDDCDALGQGGAVSISNSSGVVVSGNTISDATATWGGGIALQETAVDVVLTGNTIHDCTATGDDWSSSGGGGAINVFASDTVTISDNVVYDNVASGSHAGGGGIMVHSCTDPTLTGNSVDTSTAYAGGGAMLYSVTGTVTFSDNTFDGDSAEYGGGLLLGNVSAASFEDSSVTNCEATYTGGGLYLEGADATSFDGFDFTGNVVTTWFGGAAMICDSTDIVITNSDFTSNEATSNEGGAIWASGGDTWGMCSVLEDLEISNSTFTGNTAGSNGGGLAIRGAESVTLASLQFGTNASTAFGGGLYASSVGAFSLDGSIFSGNSGTYGGGLYAVEIDYATLEATTFTSNMSTTKGGAVRLNTSSGVLVDSCTFSSNSSQNGGALDLYEGDSTLISNNTFSSNIASASGGAMYLQGGSSNEVSGNTLSTNSARQGGGLYFYDAEVLIADTITSNTALSAGGGVYCRDSDYDASSAASIASNTPDNVHCDNCSDCTSR